MKKKNLIALSVAVILLSSLLAYFFFRKNSFPGTERNLYQLPKVLFITTGANEGNGVLAEGVVVALQTFNKHGAYVKLATRDILLKQEELGEYNLMILPTGGNYHDADRRYSLTFLSDIEMKNIKNWVKAGGILIAGDNTGRNTLEGVDRTGLFPILTPANWILGECFGVSLKESNMKGYRIEGRITNHLQGTFINASQADQYALVVDSIYSNNTKILAYWINDHEKIPALIRNKYEKGTSFLLPTFYLLHPANAGGYWGGKQIRDFFEYVLQEFYSRHKYKVQLNPWPYANDYAFCITLNAAGNKANYKRVLSFLDKEDISSTIFVNGGLDDEIKNMLYKEKIHIESNGFRRINYRNRAFPDGMSEILLNENYWDRKFKGFRFPFTRTSFWGMLSLNEIGYIFDSSIGADNLEGFYGSVFPYHIPVGDRKFYKVLDLLEVSPMLHDDYHFYKNLVEGEIYSSEQQEKDALLYEKYLLNYWKYGVKPHNGALVYIGHPMYIGHNDTTLHPLSTLVKKVKDENTWLTTINEIAEYWKELGKLRFNVSENNDRVSIYVYAPGNTRLTGVTINLDKKPSGISVKEGTLKIKEINNNTRLIFDAFNGQEVYIKY